MLWLPTRLTRPMADRQTQAGPLGLARYDEEEEKDSHDTGDKTRLSDKKKTPEQDTGDQPLGAAPQAPAPAPLPKSNAGPATRTRRWADIQKAQLQLRFFKLFLCRVGPQSLRKFSPFRLAISAGPRARRTAGSWQQWGE